MREPWISEMRNAVDWRHVVRQALNGHDVSLDCAAYSLHELTQVAAAVQPGADLSIRNACPMTPIERASIATVGKGRVMFI